MNPHFNLLLVPNYGIRDILVWFSFWQTKILNKCFELIDYWDIQGQIYYIWSYRVFLLSIIQEMHGSNKSFAVVEWNGRNSCLVLTSQNSLPLL